jgi:hypothetical protein
MRYLCICLLIIILLDSCTSTEVAVIETKSTEKSTNNSFQAEEKEYKPTQEIYDITFNMIDTLISKLNDVIRNREYDTWLGYLTDEYRAEKSDPAFLMELSSQPTLAAHKIILKSLNDYFYYVIVPSRANSKLDGIVFVNDSRVKAMSTLYGKSVILYNLVKIDGEWKIGNAK